MFKELIDFLWLVFQELFRVILNIFSWIRSYFVILASAILTVLAVVKGFIEMVWNFLGNILSMLAGFSINDIQHTSYIDFLSFANMLLPIHEFFSYLTLYLSLLILSTSIRVIKSFIPTIS